MQFDIPEQSLIEPHRSRLVSPRLQAENTMNYREFIAMIKNIWEEIYPDIPILPVQGKSYTDYPVIVYSLENRKPHQTEPKQRYREEICTEGDENIIVTGQRFDNFIAFSVITDAEPDLCEAIIESFEGFMLEYTKHFKRRGLSDIFYARRMSDREETRAGDDVCIRTVVYMCVIEHIVRTPVAKLEEVEANIAIGSSTKPLGNYAWVPEDVELQGSIVPEFDYVQDNIAYYLGDVDIRKGDAIKVFGPNRNDPFFRSTWRSYALPNMNWDDHLIKLPDGLNHGEIYTVEDVTEHNTFSLSQDGITVDFSSYGWFKIKVLKRPRKFTIDLEDNAYPATPSYPITPDF